MSKYALDRVSAKFADAVSERYTDRAGGEWAVIQTGQIREVLMYLRGDPELEFRLFVTMDAVDRLLLENPTPRFEVVYVLKSLKRNEHVRLKVRVSEEDARVPSATPVFQGANWWERFIWDFYGIRFEGHPNLKRVLLYEEFKGHPLRKDYGLRERQPLVPERPIKDLFRGPGTSGVL